MPYDITTLTAITVVFILSIVASYVSVLKRNGWIGKPAGVSESPKLLHSRIKFSISRKHAESIEDNPEKLEDIIPVIESPADTPEEESNPEPKEEDEAKEENVAKTEPKEEFSGCGRYFGYLRTLQKGAAIPDECYCCMRLIDCTKEE